MARVRATVKTGTHGEAFETTDGTLIRLARVKAPPVDITSKGRLPWAQAREDLEGLILGKEIAYEFVAHAMSGHVVAEVWVETSRLWGKSQRNVNDAMRAKGWK